MNLTSIKVWILCATGLFSIKVWTISVDAFAVPIVGIQNVGSHIVTNNCHFKAHRSKDNCNGILNEFGEESTECLTPSKIDTGTFRRWTQGDHSCERRSYLSIVSATVGWFGFANASNAKSYSENAKNLERINSGDFSGGAVFNNNPTTERGQKRRAITGCKTPLSREEASRNILKRDKVLSEKECNQMVLEGETEFMLQALRNLDCPTCPYGIGQME